MNPPFDAVVIGSGFGGAVSACRLSQAGLKVLILERGRRYARGGFPRNFRNIGDGWLWADDQGLFDFRPFDRVTVLQSAGYGGGSLIYANVHLRVPPDGFSGAWPAGYDRVALDPYYDLVAYMLDIQPITKARRPPPKTMLMSSVAERLGRTAQFVYPNIAVQLGEPDQMRPNKFGVPQSGCNYCGECDIGCNTHAKNTLDLNYLAVAEQQGAAVQTGCEAISIAPVPEGYEVVYRNHALDTTDRVRAARVFVCAGAVNSTELLLRCRDEHRTLPDLGRALGSRYSANGDFLAFAFGTKPEYRPSEGPTITTGIVVDRGQGDEKVWFIFQDGGYPKEIAQMLRLLDPRESWLRDAQAQVRVEVDRLVRRAAERHAGAPPPEVDGTAVFLAMGRDSSDGQIRLSEDGTARIHWNNLGNLPLYQAEEQLSTDVAHALGGRVAFNPFWHTLHLPVSVHNLGGCVMSEDAGKGVTDPHGEVYGYPGLYVLDGAILPAATGVNPSHTIAAVAERNVEHAVRSIRKDPNWMAPERSLATPVVDPLSRVVIPPGGTIPSPTAPVGVRFTETMKGFLNPRRRAKDDPEPTLAGFLAAEQAGEVAGNTAEFTLTIELPSLDVFLANRAHAGIAHGTVHAAGFTAPGGAKVENGVFNLFVDGDSFYQRRMLYLLPFVGEDGRPYLLDGFKDVRDHGEFDVWGSTTTLYTRVREGHDELGPVVAEGVLRIHVPDFVRQLTTITVTGARSAGERLEAQSRFGRMFVGTLWDVFVRPRLE